MTIKTVLVKLPVYTKWKPSFVGQHARQSAANELQDARHSQLYEIHHVEGVKEKPQKKKKKKLHQSHPAARSLLYAFLKVFAAYEHKITHNQMIKLST